MHLLESVHVAHYYNEAEAWSGGKKYCNDTKKHKKSTADFYARIFGLGDEINVWR